MLCVNCVFVYVEVSAGVVPNLVAGDYIQYYLFYVIEGECVATRSPPLAIALRCVRAAPREFMCLCAVSCCCFADCFLEKRIV